MYLQTEETDRKVVDQLGQIAERRGVPRAQLALAWLLSKPGSPHRLSEPLKRTTSRTQ